MPKMSLSKLISSNVQRADSSLIGSSRPLAGILRTRCGLLKRREEKHLKTNASFLIIWDWPRTREPRSLSWKQRSLMLHSSARRVGVVLLNTKFSDYSERRSKNL